MKEAIGGTWLFGLTITFIALFTTFVSVTTNYSICYKIKDEIISTIERKRGVNADTVRVINTYLNGLGYRTYGSCPADSNCWLPFRVDQSEPADDVTKANYCIAMHGIVYDIQTVNSSGELVDSGILNGALGHPNQAYYEVAVFFKIEWPILNKFFQIRIDGETSIIYLNKDFPKFSQCRN